MHVVVKIQRIFAKSVLCSIVPIDCITLEVMTINVRKNWKLGDWELRTKGLCRNKYGSKQENKVKTNKSAVS